MTTYYKGKIFCASKNKEYHPLDVYIINDHFNQHIKNDRVISFNNDMFTKLLNKEYYLLYKYQLANYIKSILYTRDNRTRYHAMHSILDEIYRQLPDNIQSEVDIIYEVIEDNHGTKHGKEIITGMLFPLYENNSFFEYSATLKDNRQKFWITPLFDNYLYVLDQEKNGYLRNILYPRIKRQIINRSDKYFIIYPCTRYGNPIEAPITEANLEEYVLTAYPTFHSNNYRICETLIKEHDLASQEEILEYKNNFENSTRYKVYIEILSNKNLPSKPIKIKTRT